MSAKRNLLSFPWVAGWDVLDSIRRSRIVSAANDVGLEMLRAMSDPFGEHLNTYIKRFARAHSVQLAKFRETRFGSSDTDESMQEKDAKHLLHRYVQRHKGVKILK